MIKQAMGNGGDFELPPQLLEVLPSDPYEQLEVARKLTSMAIASRVSKLEAEATKLRQKLAEKEQLIYGLQERLVEAEQTLQETTNRLSHALDDQVSESALLAVLFSFAQPAILTEQEAIRIPLVAKRRLPFLHDSGSFTCAVTL